MELVNKACEENRLGGEKWGTLGYMVGEDWEDNVSDIVSNTYGTESEKGLNSTFDFPLRYRVVQSLAREEWGNEVNSNRAENLNSGFETHADYPEWAHPNLMIGNHDLARIGNLIEEANVNNSSYWDRLKAIFSFQAACSGPITIYYGEEVGLRSDIYQESDLRELHISRIEGKFTDLTDDEQELYDYISLIMDLRENHSALWQEDTRTNIKAIGDIYVDYKYDTETEDKVIFALNCGSVEQDFSFSVQGMRDVKDAITGEVFTGDNFTVPMKALQARFLLVK